MRTPVIRPLLAGLIACAVLASRGAAGAPPFVVLCNKAKDVKALTKAEVQKVFSGGTKQWSGGAIVQVGIIPGEAPETQYLASLFDTTPRALLQRLQEQVFKGEMKRPVVLRSSADCAALARSSAGAVCIASAATPVPPEAHVVPVQ